MPTHSFSLRELFDVAIDLDPGERGAVLDALCPDTAQRERLERMLCLDTAERRALPQHAIDALAQSMDDIDESTEFVVGSRIGEFELIELLGEGGSSTVFRAARVSAGVRQEVALKLLRRGLYSPDAQRQFRRERVALSQLAHPGIARLIEGGVTANAQAYIALDLVEGQPITDYAREQRLGLSQRLDLFVQVCRAVEAAHHALIVHRDLKPSNVLVTVDGQVKLIDFGVAKLLDADLVDETQTRLPAFTPAYAAPEQRSGDPITTATDVYALGIVLGELVTGQRLNDGSGRTPSGEVRADAEPGVLPASPQITRRQLRGDLDNIVLKAIATEPAQRYATAGALADDIERLSAGRPVSARQPTHWYRARKFVLRHRGGVLVTALFALGVMAALALALWQGQVAQHELKRADAMRDFVFSAFAESTPNTPRSGPPSITDVVDQAIEKIHADTQMDARVRTELLTELGAVLRRQGHLNPARDSLLPNFEQAQRDFGADSPLTLFAGHELSRVLILTGDYAQARERLDHLLQHAANGENAVRAKLLMDSATLATRQSDPQRARREGEAGMMAARASGDIDILQEALGNLGNIQLNTGDVSGAIKTYTELREAHRQRFGADHAFVASDEASLARAYRRNGELELAEQHARAALAIDDAVLSKDDWRRAYHLNALEIVLRDRHDYAAARDVAVETLRVTRVAYGDSDDVDVGMEARNLGMMHLLLDDYAAATPLLREAVERYTRAFGPDHADTAYTRANLGFAAAQSGDDAAGEKELSQGLATLQALPNADPALTLTVLSRDIRLKLDRNNPAAASTQLAQMDALLAKAATRDQIWSARTDVLRALVEIEQSDFAAASIALDAAEQAQGKAAHPDVEAQIQIPLLRSLIALQHGDRPAAQRYADEGFKLLDKLPSPPRTITQLAARLHKEL